MDYHKGPKMDTREESQYACLNTSFSARECMDDLLRRTEETNMYLKRILLSATGDDVELPHTEKEKPTCLQAQMARLTERTVNMACILAEFLL